MRTKTAIIALLVILGLLVSSTTWAKVSADEAARLDKDLTPFGAERAGNAEGTIPAWDGGLTKIPEGITYPGGGAMYPDPFKDDKVLFSINAGNVDQYADKLPAYIVAMMKKYSSMRVDVYPTRRTAAAPQWVYDNTKRNATLCEMTEDRLGVIDKGGRNGIPFPIPQSAEEVIYNHLMRWAGRGMHVKFRGLVVYPDGRRNNGGAGFFWEKYPWYNLEPGEEYGGILMQLFAQFDIPSRRKGEFFLLVDPLNQSVSRRRAWQYLPGQRRVRRAPSLSYDTPQAGTAGMVNYDDAFGFSGSLDRYDWKLVGKKEMYIPYNTYAFDLATVEQVFTPLHVNPDILRYELHRVWVVEATLKEGKRHAFAKRHFYLDEDTWFMAAVDNYDGRGSLWRGFLNQVISAYDIPGVFFRSFVVYDLTREDYVSGNANCGYDSGTRHDIFHDDKMFTPENVRRRGRR